MIKVSKFGPVYRVKATRPDVPKDWSSLMPLGAREVVEELIRHGASLHAAYDAMFEADPLRAARELR
ncbi:MAG: hypothetical protein EON95_16745 [Caulobacteraceae bacterium]|nr:hypothetical protein [Caulobacter sp.]RYF90533.1 MAG: hypothetical protein EON95_16745 [Caulobacteraceae bacterium]